MKGQIVKDEQEATTRRLIHALPMSDVIILLNIPSQEEDHSQNSNRIQERLGNDWPQRFFTPCSQLTKSELIQADKITADKATTAVTCAAARADIPQRLAPSSLRPENICRAKPGSHGTLIAKFVLDQLCAEGENGAIAPDQVSSPTPRGFTLWEFLLLDQLIRLFFNYLQRAGN